MTATPPYECHWSLPSFRLDCLTILSPSHVLLRTISQPLCVCGLTKYYPKCHKFLMGYYRSPFFLFSPLHFYINLPHSSTVFLLGRLYHALHTIRAHSKCVLSGLVFWYVGRQGLFLFYIFVNFQQIEQFWANPPNPPKPCLSNFKQIEQIYL